MGGIAGSLTDAGYGRLVLMAVASLIVLGTLATSAGTAYWQVLLSQGICTGLGNGLLFAPVVSIVSVFFQKRRALAIALSTCGSAVGGLVFPSMARELLAQVGFPWAMRAIGILQAGTLVIAVGGAKPPARMPDQRKILDLSVFHEMQYDLFTFGLFLVFTGLFVPFFSVANYAREVQGASFEESTNYILVLNGVGVGTRTGMMTAVVSFGALIGPPVASKFVSQGHWIKYLSMSAITFRQILGAKQSTASPSDSTLIIIDAQNEYASGKLAVHDVDSSRTALASLLQKYRSVGGKVVHVVHRTPPGAPVFTPGTALEAIFDEFTPRREETTIEKVHPSSFANTNLHEHLGGVAGSKIVLAGYMAHVCVSTTARDAARLGYDVIVAEDCIGDRDIPGLPGPVVTKAVLCELADAFATVVSSSDIR
ncbi:hypothetical protein KC353_g8172 [Hortaea werneckii]|nr:hypothetical protein KC353_g8172 [Hortaea werneckii]